MSSLRRVAVFCGSSLGNRAVYANAARRFGDALARREIGLVYGGAGVGLMGTLADTVAAAGGSVVGVIPRALVEREIAHETLTDLRVVESMHERKALMSELSDAFVALPGGMGTLDELADAVTWHQLGIHAKPCGLLDGEGYFTRFVEFLEHATAEGFLRTGDRDSLLVDADPHDLLDRLVNAEPRATKWLLRETPRP
jgi:uncharacterized protein (TIGR00730 family)